MIKAIIPECFVDTCLINIFLKLEKESVNHGKGNSTVANKMKTAFNNSFAVGILDRDKREIEYIKEFNLENERLGEKILLFKHPDKHHYIIQLCPESENWICNVATDLDINMESEYGLPNGARDLAKLSKNINVAKDERFVPLFKEIRKRSYERGYDPVIKLIYWLETLRDNNYNVDLNDLRN